MNRYFLRAILSSLAFNKMRVVVTGLGVFIGVASVITVISLAQSLMGSLANTGGDSFSIGLASSAAANIDVEARLRQPDMQARIAALRVRPDVIGVQEDVGTDSVRVTFPDTGATQQMGVAFADDAVTSAGVGFGSRSGNLAILIENPDFPVTVAAGSSIVIGGEVFSVLGFARDNPAPGVSIVLPQRLANQTPIIEAEGSGTLTVRVTDPTKLETTRASILRELNQGMDVELKFVDYSAEQQQAAQSALQTVGSFLALLASISLAVAALNIFNVMYIASLERADEIAIYRSMGMRKRNVVSMFLLEALIVVGAFALLGALGGVAVAAIAATLLGAAASLSWVSLVVLVLIIAVVGVGGGAYPAIRAAGVDPVRLMR